MRVIESRVLVWPPVSEILNASYKYRVIQLLDKIANDVTQTVRPKTKRIAIPLKKKPTNVVIKRERSDAARHCLLPTDIQTNTLIQLNKYLEKESVADSFWMAQEFVPELIGIGEWRTYFVGGENNCSRWSPSPQRKGSWRVGSYIQCGRWRNSRVFFWVLNFQVD
jgi:glutathione synthase/RimK-type ligase-like ATP-grasp enzyme